MLGLQLHGRPDAVVLSVFEDAPLAAAAEAMAPPSRYRSRDPAGGPGQTTAARQPAHSNGVRRGHAEAGGSSGAADPAVGNSAQPAPPWSLCSPLELQQVRLFGCLGLRA